MPVDPIQESEEAAANEEEARREGRRQRMLSRAERSAREWKATARALERDLEEAETRLEAMVALRKPTKPLTIRPKRRSGSGEAVAWAIASDWHVEEEVRAEQVSGLNEHNLSIADEKVGCFFRNLLELVAVNRTAREIRTLVLVLGGDFFSGHIHEDLVEVTELSPTESLVWLKARITAGIDLLLEHGDLEHLVIPCVWGNHGRTTKKRRISTSGKHSYEWLLYQWLGDHYGGEKRVSFQVAEGYHLWVDCAGQAVRIHHGDEVRYQGGVGGLTIPLNKAIGAWNQARRADLDLLGHWHQLLFLPRAVVNGSLIGYGPFAVACKAAFELPAQAFFLLDCKHGRRTMQTPIFLE